MRLLPLVALVALLGLSCGPSTDLFDAAPGSDIDASTTGGADAPGPDAAGMSGCTLSLTGDKLGTLPCTTVAGKKTSDDFSIVAASSSQSNPSVTSVAFSVRITGEVTVRDYTAADAQAVAVSLMTGDGKMYVASSGTGQAQGTIGTLHLTALEAQASDDPSVKVWKPHGTFGATLVGTSQGSGQITLAASF